ncbi:hypothetical protein D3C72_1848800 [compost metagenome]
MPGDRQGLFGSGQLVLAVEACTDQLFALFEGGLLALAQGGLALFQFLLLMPQVAECFHLALLLAIFLQQLAEQTDLFSQGVGFSLGFVVEQGKGGALLLQCSIGLLDPLLQTWQFGASLIQPVTQLHQLLQAVAVGTPGVTQACQ